MKCKLAKVLLLCFLLLLLSSCQGEMSKSERLSNALEAYLYAMSSGDVSVNEPIIKDFSNEEKSKIVNQLTFAFIFEREDYLISYLDRQWEEWRNDDGFIVNYLKNRLELEEKRLANPEKVELELKLNQQLNSLEDFYDAVQTNLVNQGHSLAGLYLIKDSKNYKFNYNKGVLVLDSATILLMDIPQNESFSCIYNKGKLFISSANSIDMKRDNKALVDMPELNQNSLLSLVDEKLESAELIYTVSRPFIDDAMKFHFDGVQFIEEKETNDKGSVVESESLSNEINDITQPTTENIDFSAQELLAYVQLVSGEVKQNFMLYR